MKKLSLDSVFIQYTSPMPKYHFISLLSIVIGLVVRTAVLFPASLPKAATPPGTEPVNPHAEVAGFVSDTCATIGYYTTYVNDTICVPTVGAVSPDPLDSTTVTIDTLTAELGCDSFVVRTTHFVDRVQVDFHVYICAGETPSPFPQSFWALSDEVCDTFYLLNITVYPLSTGEITAEICQGQTYHFNGQILDTAGEYSADLTSVEGCDSIVTLTLTVTPLLTETITAEICEGKAYNFNGQLLTESGTYVEDQTTADGCDSLAILHLVVTPPPIDTIADEICEPVYYFPGAPRETGTYFAVVTDAEGCEMVIRLDLVVHPIQVEQIKVTIDEGDAYLLPDGSTEATTSGTYSFTLTSAQGCDSIVVVDVRVLPHLVPAPEPGEISEEGDLGKNKRKRFSDWVSPVPLPLRSGPATDQVPMDRALSGPTEEVSFDVYPNPCGDQLTLDTHELDLPNTATVRLFDLSGREVPLAVTWRSGTVPVDVSHVPPGVYLIKLIGEDRPLAVAKMVKY